MALSWPSPRFTLVAHNPMLPSSATPATKSIGLAAGLTMILPGWVPLNMSKFPWKVPMTPTPALLTAVPVTYCGEASPAVKTQDAFPELGSIFATRMSASPPRFGRGIDPKTVVPDVLE